MKYNEKLLIIKPQTNNGAYTRKLSMSYGHNNILLVTYDNISISEIGVENKTIIRKYKNLPYSEKKNYNKDKHEVLDEDTLMITYYPVRRIVLKYPVRLEKHLNNIRHSTPSETLRVVMGLHKQLKTNKLTIHTNNTKRIINLTVDDKDNRLEELLTENNEPLRMQSRLI